MRWIRLNIVRDRVRSRRLAKADEQLRPSGAVYRGVALAHARPAAGSARAGPRRADAAREVLDHADACSRRARAPVHRAARRPARRARAPRRRPRRGARRGRSRHRPDPVLQRGRGAPRARRGRRATIAADASERARDLGDEAAEATAVARAEGLLELIGRGGRGRRPRPSSRPGGDRRGGAVPGPRRGRSRAWPPPPLPGTTSSGPTTAPWPGGARRRPSSPEATGRARDPRGRARPPRDRRHVAQQEVEGFRRSRPAATRPGRGRR